MRSKRISEVILNDYSSLYRGKENGNWAKLSEMGIAILVQILHAKIHIYNSIVSTALKRRIYDSLRNNYRIL